MLQEGFIQIFRDLYQFQPNRPLAAWMRRVVANACEGGIRTPRSPAYWGFPNRVPNRSCHGPGQL